MAYRNFQAERLGDSLLKLFLETPQAIAITPAGVSQDQQFSRLSIVLASVTIGIPCMAQDVEPPFTWEGKGVASFISEGGIEETDFQFELSVDEQGMVDGKASNEDGTTKIKHVFYSEPKQYELPGFFTRNIVIVLMFNEYSDNRMLSIVNGRILVGKFLYGEMMLTAYEAGSDTAKALGIGDSEATLMEGDELPNSLKSAMKKCLPLGIVKIEGGYKNEETATAAGGDSEKTESKDSDSVALFNKRNLNNWHVYLKDTDADPKNVWKVQDGAISCTGEPVGFLRTKEEYSDYKLVLEWRWPGWNTYEITCRGDTIEATVNGQLQNKATGVTIAKGYIGLQSEGVPIMFRNIKLTPLH